jgi:hypothetical protein
MAEDLLEAGGRPGVRGYGADGRVRLVSVFSLGIHESSPGESNGTASRAGRLVFRTVKLLAGSDWLVTCWHEDANEAALHEAVATARTRLDAVDQPPSPGDLAINVVYSVCDPSVAPTGISGPGPDSWICSDFGSSIPSMLGGHDSGLTLSRESDSEVSERRHSCFSSEGGGRDTAAWRSSGAFAGSRLIKDPVIRKAAFRFQCPRCGRCA